MAPRKTVLDEIQQERDEELAEYLRVPLGTVLQEDISDRQGPPIYVDEDLNLDTYNHLYETFSFTTELRALRAFSLFIVQKRGSLVRRLVQKVKRTKGLWVLDFGCGVGSHGIYMLQRGVARVTFVDVDGPAFRYAKWRVERRGFGGHRYEFVPTTGDIGGDEYDIGGDEYDMVICLDVLEHVADPMAELGRIVRLHKTRGWLLLQLGKKLNPRQGHFFRSNKILESRAFRKRLKKNYAAGERFFYRRK